MISVFVGILSRFVALFDIRYSFSKEEHSVDNYDNTSSTCIEANWIPKFLLTSITVKYLTAISLT